MAQEFVVVILEDFEITPQEIKARTTAELSAQLKGPWKAAEFELEVSAFVLGEEDCPLSGNAIAEMESSGLLMTAWVRRGPGWFRAPWMEFVVRQLLDGNVKAELAKAKRHIGTLQHHLELAKEANGDTDTGQLRKENEELKELLKGRDERIKDLEGANSRAQKFVEAQPPQPNGAYTKKLEGLLTDILSFPPSALEIIKQSASK